MNNNILLPLELFCGMLFDDGGGGGGSVGGGVGCIDLSLELDDDIGTTFKTVFFYCIIFIEV